jgi:hypothetical protein
VGELGFPGGGEGDILLREDVEEALGGDEVLHERCVSAGVRRYGPVLGHP